MTLTHEMNLIDNTLGLRFSGAITAYRIAASSQSIRFISDNKVHVAVI